MEHTHVTPDYKVRLTDKAIARLLGITMDEYHILSHRPIEANTDIKGEITEFYIHISSNNTPELLSKLNCDASNFVRFKPEEVYALYV